MGTPSRFLGNVNMEQAEANGWEVDAGNPGAWEVVCKVHNRKAKMMKSTKRMRLENGWLYQVTTEGPFGYAESLAYVPDKQKSVPPTTK
jgi:hypothetical protein